MYDPANSNQPGLSVNMFKKLPTVKIILPSEMTNEHGCIFAGDFAISLTMCQLRYTHSPGHFWDFKILLRSRNVRTFIYGNLRQKRIYYLVDFVDHCTKSHFFFKSRDTLP